MKLGCCAEPRENFEQMRALVWNILRILWMFCSKFRSFAEPPENFEHRAGMRRQTAAPVRCIFEISGAWPLHRLWDVLLAAHEIWVVS